MKSKKKTCNIVLFAYFLSLIAILSIVLLDDRINDMDQIRCRIAPSPTGNLHVGTAHTALFNYLFAKHNHGTFILRIDDSDRVRSKKEFENNITESLKWLGIHWDEGADIGGPYASYRQSERNSTYKKYIDQLLRSDKAYYCYCTPEELKQEREKQEQLKEPPKYSGRCAHLTDKERKRLENEGRKPSVRFRTPHKIVKFHDLIRGDIEVDTSLFGDFVIARSNGSALLNISATVDDIEMHITHAIRGEDFLNLTPRQILLSEALGYRPPQFAHLSFLYAPDRTKLSKRHGATSITEYTDMGILPEAMVNYLATLGWSFSTGATKDHNKTVDIFTLDDAIRNFDITKVQKSAPIFDYEKLCWMNGEYIRMKTDQELIAILDTYARQTNLKLVNGQMAASQITNYKMKQILPLVKERMKTLAEFESLAGFFFARPQEFERPLKVSPLKVVAEALKSCDWNHDAMEKAIRAAAEAAGQKAKDVFMELRLAVTGKTVGPPLLESLEILGKEETFCRLNLAI